MTQIPTSSPEQEAAAKDFRDAVQSDRVRADYWPADGHDILVPFVQVWTAANTRIPTEVVWFTSPGVTEWGNPNRDLVYPFISPSNGHVLWAEVKKTIGATA